jgi:hypothetical protein
MKSLFAFLALSTLSAHAEPNHKVIQLTYIPLHNTLVAVCDDGSLWETELALGRLSTNPIWQQVTTPPPW